MVLEDGLGIGENRQEMARIVDSYQCGQTTLNDPQRLALFRSFVGDQPDEAAAPRSARSAAAAAD
ncbi:hypothetical protein MJ561_17895 [Klebsiella pneumoniae]|nr:hypothetical protein MJ561_17895 [Klebsiella pneumoniae]